MWLGFSSQISGSCEYIPSEFMATVRVCFEWEIILFLVHSSQSIFWQQPRYLGYLNMPDPVIYFCIFHCIRAPKLWVSIESASVSQYCASRMHSGQYNGRQALLHIAPKIFSRIFACGIFNLQFYVLVNSNYIHCPFDSLHDRMPCPADREKNEDKGEHFWGKNTENQKIKKKEENL